MKSTAMFMINNFIEQKMIIEVQSHHKHNVVGIVPIQFQGTIQKKCYLIMFYIILKSLSIIEVEMRRNMQIVVTALYDI